MAKAITTYVRGIKCDNTECGWKDMTVSYEDHPKYIDKPCPCCGDLASYIGHINFDGSPEEDNWNAIKDMLQEAKENFKRIYKKCHNIDIAFDTFVSKEQESQIRDIIFHGISNEERNMVD